MTAALWAGGAGAETLRLAVFHADLERDGPGLLLRDIERGEDAQIAASLATVAAVDPDVLLLLGFDYDAGLVALTAYAEALRTVGTPYPHLFALRPNSGRASGVDFDGDGVLHEPEDNHGYGWFSGEGGMALLSRVPIGAARDFSDMLWRDLPGSSAPEVLSDDALDVIRLSSMAIWDVALETDAGALHILAIHATAPVFDGPEDRNGLRNRDEIGFLLRYLDGWAPDGAPLSADPVTVMGTFNVDPDRGEGLRDTLLPLLAHPRLQDPRPERPGGGTETVDWADPTPGDLRVDYVLPA
ncbi:MAG: endonuclease/exonuclease/phosphatase family protein, partial [Pseudomonadota bacterium]